MAIKNVRGRLEANYDGVVILEYCTSLSFPLWSLRLGGGDGGLPRGRWRSLGLPSPLAMKSPSCLKVLLGGGGPGPDADPLVSSRGLAETESGSRRDRGLMEKLSSLRSFYLEGLLWPTALF